MTPEQHDKVMEMAHVMAYANARNVGLDHFKSMIVSKHQAKHLIDEAYDYLGFKKPEVVDQREKL